MAKRVFAQKGIGFLQKMISLLMLLFVLHLQMYKKSYMMTKIFGKSNPMNLALIAALILVVFLIVVFTRPQGTDTNFWFFTSPVWVSLSLFIIQFFCKKNNITRGHDYTLLLYGLFVMLIPDILLNPDLLASNFFVLLALRRLSSLQTHQNIKLKIYDAALWIGVAALFEFWAILFFLLIHIAVLVHVANDVRNWFIPIVGFITVGVLALMVSTLLEFDLLGFVSSNMVFDLSLTQLTDLFLSFDKAFFACLLVFLFFYQFTTLPNYLNTLQNSLKVILTMLVIGFGVYLVSKDSPAVMFVYIFAPLSIIGGNFIDSFKNQWKQELFIWAILLSGIVSLTLKSIHTIN